MSSNIASSPSWSNLIKASDRVRHTVACFISLISSCLYLLYLRLQTCSSIHSSASCIKNKDFSQYLSLFPSITNIHSLTMLLDFGWGCCIYPLPEDQTLPSYPSWWKQCTAAYTQSQRNSSFSLCIHFFSFCCEQRTSSLWCEVIWFSFMSDDYHTEEFCAIIIALSVSHVSSTICCFNMPVLPPGTVKATRKTEVKKGRNVEVQCQPSAKIFTPAASCPDWQLQDICLSFIMHYPNHLAAQTESEVTVSMSVTARQARLISVWISGWRFMSSL